MEDFLNYFIFGFAGSCAARAFSGCGESGLLSSCSLWVSHCSGFYCCGAQTLGHKASVVAAPGLESTGLIVVAHGLSCSTICGIFLDQGSNPCLLHQHVDSLPLSHQGNPCKTLF